MRAESAAETERLHRQLLRYVMTGLAAVLGSGVILGLVQANVQEWAKTNNQDQYLVKYAGPIMDRLMELTQSSTFFAIAWAVIGAASILWIDYAVRRRTKKMAVALYVIAAALIGLATWVLFHPAKSAEATLSPNISAASLRPLGIVSDKTFKDEKVIIDGYDFRNVTFENTTIIYNGGSYAFNGVNLRNVFLTSERPEILGFAQLATALTRDSKQPEAAAGSGGFKGTTISNIKSFNNGGDAVRLQGNFEDTKIDGVEAKGNKGSAVNMIGVPGK